MSLQLPPEITLEKISEEDERDGEPSIGGASNYVHPLPEVFEVCPVIGLSDNLLATLGVKELNSAPPSQTFVPIAGRIRSRNFKNRPSSDGLGGVLIATIP